jgi:hypothetical protein
MFPTPGGSQGGRDEQQQSQQQFGGEWQDLNQSVTSLLQELDIPRAISCPPHLDDRWGNPLVGINVIIVNINREAFNTDVLVDHCDINSCKK